MQEHRDPQVLAEKAKPAKKQGRPKKEEKGTASTFKARGSTADYRTAKIARDKPEILEEMKADFLNGGFDFTDSFLYYALYA